MKALEDDQDLMNITEKAQGSSNQPRLFVVDFLQFSLISLMRDTIMSVPEGEMHVLLAGDDLHCCPAFCCPLSTGNPGSLHPLAWVCPIVILRNLPTGVEIMCL